MRCCLLVVVLSACGRVGFNAVVDAPLADGALDAPPAAIAYVGSFAAHVNFAAASDTFAVTAQHAGDSMLLHVFCETGTPPTAVTLTGTAGWTWTQLTSIASAGSFRGLAFGAIAPDTTPATFSITWAIAPDSCSFLDEMGDELTMNDPAGGAMTFEAAVTGASMTGSCETTLTTLSTNAALWSACTTNCVTAPAAGFTKSSDDGHCDATEYRLPTDPAGTLEMLSFATSAGTTFIATSVAVRGR